MTKPKEIHLDIKRLTVQSNKGCYYLPYLPIDHIRSCHKVIEPKWRKGRKRKRSPKKTSIVNYNHKINYIGSDSLEGQKITYDEV